VTASFMSADGSRNPGCPVISSFTNDNRKSNPHECVVCPSFVAPLEQRTHPKSFSTFSSSFYNTCCQCNSRCWYKQFVLVRHFCRAMLCVSAAIAVMQCPSVRLSVRLSVTFVDHVMKFFHHSSFFHTKRGDDIPTEPPNGGVECRWGIGRNRDSGLIAGYRRLLDVRSAKNIY